MARRIGLALLGACGLELHRGPDCLHRGLEHRESLVAPQLDDPAAPGLDGVQGQVGEPLGEARGGGIPALPRKPCVTANVGDQEGQDRGRPAGCVGH
jgi:hypothetical protein